MKILFLLVSIIILICPTLQAQTIINSDAEWYPFVITEKLDSNSPANIGKLVLDTPAGKHGFCKAKDSRFYFEDGTPAKFWGTNLCMSACFPNHKQAEQLADRIAFFGFNAVRLHHLDWGFEPDGIFKDINPSAKDPQNKPTGYLSQEQLDKLDYLIYQLKQRGIYIDLNLLVTRKFTLADGVREADKLGRAAKPASLFNQKLIELQKEYAKALLTHYNPYTKLHYNDEPAICLLEITNENSLKRLGSKNLPSSYKAELANELAAWKIRSKDTNQDRFHEEVENAYFNLMIDFLRSEVQVKTPIANSQYSNIDNETKCDFIDRHSYWDHPEFPNNSVSIHNFTITDKSIFSSKSIGLISDLLKRFPQSAKTKPFTVTEWNHCYPNIYAYETPAVLAAEAVKNQWDALFQFAFTHGVKEKLIINNINGFFDIAANAQQLILNSIASFLFLREKTVSTKFELGKYFIKSNHLEGAVGFLEDTPIELFDFTVTPDQKGAYFALKGDKNYVLFAVSEIRNSSSGWFKKVFQWGNPPSILRRINIELRGDKNFKIYALSAEGKRKKEIKGNLLNGKRNFKINAAETPWFEILTD